jgi:alkanesulfonate monooxygenase SsuD/methylene tetrahydromethanopterin reductase-like flavin-dependent oxidoreductase (luciferase family)
MDVGVGLPNTIPGTDGPTLIEWAKRAESLGFSTVGTIGRLVYPSYEDLISLAAAAAVTTRIRLTTGVLLSPLYTNTALLAKQAASVDRLSGGRLVLGLGLGGREDDFAASGLTTKGRARLLEEQVAEMRKIWQGEERGTAGAIGPQPVRPEGPQIILGGSTEAGFRRVARIADGWIMGGGTPDMFAQMAPGVDAAWQEAGRPGKPRKLAGTYFSLGADGRANADNYLLDYYGWLGPIAKQIAGIAAIDAATVKSYVDGFAANGCDEVVFVPATSDLSQLEMLAEAAL